VLEDAEVSLAKAVFVYFLGFGFDERNLQKLNVPQCLSSNAVIRSTTYRWSAAEVAAMRPLFGNHPNHLYSVDVISFLRETAEALFD